MGWFQDAGANPSGDARGALVSVRGPGDGRTAGAGVYLSERSVLTCAHVVNDALGRGMFAADDPGAADVDISLPGSLSVAGRAGWIRARVARWIAPRLPEGGPVPEGAREWAGDLAVLELDQDPPPSVQTLPWQDMTETQEVRAWYGGGQDFTVAHARVGWCDGRIGYLDGQLSGAEIGPGYSGGPVWSSRERAVVGLVAARIGAAPGAFSAQQVIRRSWAIPWQAIRAELHRIGADALLSDRAGPTGQAADVDPVQHKLAYLLGAVLPDPAARADHARRLALQCGLRPGAEGSAPTVEEVAAVVVAHPRALATLTESLAPAVRRHPTEREVLDQLLALGRLVPGMRLLSHAEHIRLSAQLTQLTDSAALLSRAVRGALPHAILPEPLRSSGGSADRIEEIISGLEAFTGDSVRVPDGTPRVPALLRVVEYVAACCADRVSSALRDCNDQIAARLGIHVSAVAERRADAVAWAASRNAASSRFVVRLDPEHGESDEQRYRCVVWIDAGDGRLAREDVDERRSRSAGEIAQLLRVLISQAEARHANDSGSVPVLEVVVPRDGLQVPVDEWDGAEPDELFPALLGEDYHVVLRCPDGRRRSRTADSELRRRWQQLGHGSPLRVDHAISSHLDVYRSLKSTHRDCDRVVIQCGHALRARVLDVCLAMGVPVVLWDRGADDPGPPPRLDGVEPDGWAHELPERVRRYRVEAFTHPEVHSARPALVWEDADSALPRQQYLTDPTEPTEIR